MSALACRVPTRDAARLCGLAADGIDEACAKQRRDVGGSAKDLICHLGAPLAFGADGGGMVRSLLVGDEVLTGRRGLGSLQIAGPRAPRREHLFVRGPESIGRLSSTTGAP